MRTKLTRYTNHAGMMANNDDVGIHCPALVQKKGLVAQGCEFGIQRSKVSGDSYEVAPSTHLQNHLH